MVPTQVEDVDPVVAIVAARKLRTTASQRTNVATNSGARADLAAAIAEAQAPSAETT